MGFYRKKPVVIEAFQYSGHGYDIKPKWFENAIAAGIVSMANGACVIKTLEGYHAASVTDYIIKGIKGELYPCKPDIFALTYEAVEPQPIPTTGAIADPEGAEEDAA